MSLDTYDCERCGDSFGIAGTNSGSDDDNAADEYYASQVEFHESRQCKPKPDPHAEYADGLRALADEIEAHPEVGLPLTGIGHPYGGIHFSPKDRDEFAAVVAWMSNPQAADHDGTGKYYRVDGKLHGLHIFALQLADRLGGREVTRTVTTFEVEPFAAESVQS